MSLPSSPKAVLLLSGGLDSTTTLAIAKDEGFQVHALTIEYGQRHDFEVEAARLIGTQWGITEHHVISIDLSLFGGSALTGSLEVPQGRSEQQRSQGIPVTYVPARNTVFLSIALAWAETLACFDIFIGVNALDYSGYPDCRPEYIRAFEDLSQLATKASVEGKGQFRIHTPLINMSKSAIIQKGTELGVDYSLTHSCYAPQHNGRPCRSCDACLLRHKGFLEAGLDDPLLS